MIENLFGIEGLNIAWYGVIVGIGSRVLGLSCVVVDSSPTRGANLASYCVNL